MSSPHSPVRDVPASPETLFKASFLHGFARALENHNALPRVLARVDALTRVLVLDPPPVTSWIRFDEAVPLLLAMEAELGVEGVRAIMAEAYKHAFLPLWESFISGLLRLFGATPHTLLARIPEVVRSTSRGVDADYIRVGDRALRVRITYAFRDNVPVIVFHSLLGLFDALFQYCGFEKTELLFTLVRNDRRNAADFHVCW